MENNDILSWTFTPQAQSAARHTVGTTAVIPFQGGPANNAYDYTALLTGGGAHLRDSANKADIGRSAGVQQTGTEKLPVDSVLCLPERRLKTATAFAR